MQHLSKPAKTHAHLAWFKGEIHYFNYCQRYGLRHSGGVVLYLLMWRRCGPPYDITKGISGWDNDTDTFEKSTGIENAAKINFAWFALHHLLGHINATKFLMIYDCFQMTFVKLGH